MTKKKQRVPRRYLQIKSRACVMQALTDAGYKFDLLHDKDEADFRVHPKDGKPAFNVCAKSRCYLWAEKRNDNLHIAFCDPPDSDNCEVYMYPHDEFLTLFIKKRVGKNQPPEHWEGGYRSWPILHAPVRHALIANGFTLRTPQE